jgi:4-amino-4-deoxy-L-arabinose transferase-like glycosyltransferase
MSFATDRWARFHPAWEVVLWSIVAILTVSPIRETAFLDDWAYARMVDVYLRSGSHQADAWVAANPVMQIHWGAMFSYFFGFSHSTLRVSTLVLSAGALASLYFLARDSGLHQSAAAVLTLVLASSPLFLQLSFSFMTDVPFVAFLLVSLALYGRGLSRRSPTLLFLASMAGAATVLTRQFGAVLIPAVLLAGTGLLGPRTPLRLLGIGLVLPVVSTAYQLWLGAASPNWTAERLVNDQVQHLKSLEFVGEALWRPGIVLMYLALFALPLVVPLTRRLVVAPRYGPEAAFGFVVVLTVAGGTLADGRPFLLPFLPWNLDLLEQWPAVMRAVLTASTVCGAALIGGCIWRRYADVSRRPSRPSDWLVDLTAGTYMASQLVFVQFGDEYLIPLLPYVLIVVGRDLWLHQPAQKFAALRTVTVTMMLLTALHHRALLGVGEARWAGGEIAERLGGRPDQISASWEWEAFHGSFDRFIVSATGDSDSMFLLPALMDYFTRWLPQSNERALFLSVPLDNEPDGSLFAVHASVPYRDMFFRPKSVYVVSRLPFQLRSCSGGYETEGGGTDWWRWTADRIGCTFTARVQLPVSAVVAFEYWTPAGVREVVVRVGDRSFRRSLLSNGKHSLRTERLAISEDTVEVEIRLADQSLPRRLSETDPRVAAFLVQNLRLEVAQ